MTDGQAHLSAFGQDEFRRSAFNYNEHFGWKHSNWTINLA